MTAAAARFAKGGEQEVSHAKLTANFKAVLKRSDACADPLTACLDLLAGTADGQLAEFVGSVPPSDRYFWISSTYTALMRPSRRRRLAAYFTPPFIVDYVLDRIVEYGADLAKCSLADPACGGGAFLAPAARRIAEATELAGPELRSHLEEKLLGIEIEPSLAKLAAAMIDDVCGGQSAATKNSLGGTEELIRIGNSLKLIDRIDRKFDVVLVNPPYGRLFRPSSRIKLRWGHVLTCNYVNLYAVFCALAVEMARPGGVVALVIPTSFIGGEYYSALRSYLVSQAEVIAVDLIGDREAVFVDVVQDTCVLFLRRAAADRGVQVHTTCSVVDSTGRATRSGVVEIGADGGPWRLPAAKPNVGAGRSDARLADYGYRARTGNVVWNRSKSILSSSGEEAGVIPLLWASDVKAGRSINAEYIRATSPGVRSRYAKIGEDSKVLIRKPAILVQRTTNRRQNRRVVAAVVDSTVCNTWGAFVSENHTIVIEPLNDATRIVPLGVMCDVLNSKYFDDEFRRISGTVSVGTRLIEKVALPDVEGFLAAISTGVGVETALEAARSGDQRAEWAISGEAVHSIDSATSHPANG